MNRSISLVLWLLVIVMGGLTFFAYSQRRTANAPGTPGGETMGSSAPMSSGAVMVDVPWKHLPDVERFQLTNQVGEDFDSASLDGKVYAVSFFFATCPTICRDLNRQIKRLNEQLAGEEIQFVSISVDPENDTPDVLGKYAQDFGATPDRWQFLTGPMHRIKRLGEQVFRVVVDKATHTDNILLIDKWGRYRDRFKWDDAYEAKRFAKVVRELNAETSPPIEAIVNTRNALALTAGKSWETTPWIREFRLTTSENQPFFSRDLTGRVWVGSFFFSTCPSICPRQNAYLAALRKRLESPEVAFVSITTDPVNDTPERLREYASEYRASPDQWYFLTGNEKLIRRISAEFFRVSAGPEHHSSRLFVVDRWGRVRGSFDWQRPEQEPEMLALIGELEAEPKPTTDFKVRQPE